MKNEEVYHYEGYVIGNTKDVGIDYYDYFIPSRISPSELLKQKLDILLDDKQ